MPFPSLGESVCFWHLFFRLYLEGVSPSKLPVQCFSSCGNHTVCSSATSQGPYPNLSTCSTYLHVISAGSQLACCLLSSHLPLSNTFTNVSEISRAMPHPATYFLHYIDGHHNSKAFWRPCPWKLPACQSSCKKQSNDKTPPWLMTSCSTASDPTSV